MTTDSFSEIGRRLDSAMAGKQQADLFLAAKPDALDGVKVQLDSLHPGSRYMEEAMAEVMVEMGEEMIGRALAKLEDRGSYLKKQLETALSPKELEQRAEAVAAREAAPSPPEGGQLNLQGQGSTAAKSRRKGA